MKTLFSVMLITIAMCSTAIAQTIESGPVHNNHVHVDCLAKKKPKVTGTPNVAWTSKEDKEFCRRKYRIRIKLSHKGPLDKSPKDFFTQGAQDIAVGLEF